MSHKFTHNEFLNMVFHQYGKRFEILDQYINMDTKIHVHCNNCNDIIEIAPVVLLTRPENCCSKCNKIKAQQKSYNNFPFDKIDNQYKIISNFSNINDLIVVKHLTCNKSFITSPQKMLQGYKCPYCNKNCKLITADFSSKKHLEFQDKLFHIHNNKFELNEPFISTSYTILISCTNCGYQKRVLPNDLLSPNYKCLNCNDIIVQRNRTTDSFQQELNNLYGVNKYTLLSDYAGSHELIRIKCNTCGNVWEPLAGSLLRGKACPECGRKNAKEKCTKALDDFKAEVYKLYGNRYEIKGNYINNKTKILVHCNNCNHDFEIIPSSLLRDNQCPFCNMSGGEALCDEYLKNNQFYYKFQYYINECKDKSTLPFDFAVFINEENMRLQKPWFLIEIDGEQHRKIVSIKEDTLEKRQKRFEYTIYHDKIKTDFCKENNIPLFRFEYNSRGYKRLQMKQQLYKELTDFIQRLKN